MPVVRTYRAPIRELVLNLVDNALKHHDRETGRIEVRCARVRGAIVCTVADDGPGIPGEHRGRVFDMFQTLRPRDDVEGSGIGLAFVKKLVETQGGRVEIIDRGTERGTKICFSWPVGED
jgi:signal transduction histidine kinase